MYRSGSDTGFYDKCSAVRALRVYLRPRFSLHRTENGNITLRPLKSRYHSDMEFSVHGSCRGIIPRKSWYYTLNSWYYTSALLMGQYHEMHGKSRAVRAFPPSLIIKLVLGIATHSHKRV